MLIGISGTRKSTGINIAEKLLHEAGYHTFAATKTRQEKFLLDLADQGKRLAQVDDVDGSSILDQNLWEDDELDPTSIEYYIDKPPVEVLIAADEFNIFIGEHNTDFIAILGDLWDKDKVYTYRLKNSDSVFIPYPTISILGGDTATGFSDAFPPKTLTQGFFARLLLVYGEPTGEKIFPIPEPDMQIQKQLVQLLHKIKEQVVGEITETPEATAALKEIYDTWKPMEDLRFESYGGRRLVHLIKLCLILVANRVSTQIEVQDVIYANTILTYTERLMPKALGEFGIARNSAVTHKIMIAVNKAAQLAKPISTREIWMQIHSDLEGRNQMFEILGNLELAKKIQQINEEGINGWLPYRKTVGEVEERYIDWSLLSDKERKLI